MVSGNDKKMYGENSVLRGRVFVACLICAFILVVYHVNIFHSYYDKYMEREIFRHYADELGLFWKLMNNMIASSYLVSAIVLAVNIPFAKKRSFAAAVSDLIVYGFLALSIPVAFLLSMIGTRSYIVDLKSFGFVFEVIAFIFFAGAFVIHLKTCFGTRGNFAKEKFAFWIPLVCILLMALPLSFLGRAVKLSADYAPNYGRFKVDSDGYDPAVENVIFYIFNDSVESDGALYLCNKDRFRGDNPYSIEKLDADGNYTHVADIDGVDDGFRFDVYKGKIYYLSTTKDRPNLNFEIISKDIASGEKEVIYSDVAEGVATDSDTWYMNFSMFKIKDGVLYFYIFGDNDNSIYCIDLDAETYTKELYVSDILGSNIQLTFAYLYHYRYSVPLSGSNCSGRIYRGEYSYSFFDDVDHDEDGHAIYTTTLRKLTHDNYVARQFDLYISEQINGSCYYNGCFYFFENDTKEISCFDISSESMSTVASVDGADTESDYTMYVYGENILLVSETDPSDYFVICI